MNMPVYLFTGFLEGGKTSIIQESLEDKRFNSGEKTLLILCEEGERELEPEKFWGRNVIIRVIEDEFQEWGWEHQGELCDVLETLKVFILTP